MPTADLPQGDKTTMFFTYILKSLRNGDIYIGSTRALENRVKAHNSGKVRSTKSYRPWRLVECQTFTTRSEAVRWERFLKRGQQRETLKRKYGHVAK